MPRPIEFNRVKAVENAMLLFWQQGYTATSLPQLLTAMKIGRSSFYAAFSSKRSLYVEALLMFAARTEQILNSVSQQDNPIKAIHQFFDHTLFQVPERRMRLGCLLVNTVLELAHTDPDLNQLAADKLNEIEAGFAECFRTAQQAGTLASHQDAKSLAQFVMTLNQGLRVASRQGRSKKQLQDSVNTSLALLNMAA